MYYRFVTLFLVVFSCLFFFSPSARSEEIVITAKNFEDSSAETVSDKSPTSFTEQVKIRPLGYGLIDTTGALRLAVDVDLPNYGGTIPAPVSLRGSSFQQTLVMLDGIPLSSSLGDILDLSLYTIPEIELIEIIKGSNSAVYGPSAMGGVVNIVTRKPNLTNSVELTSSQGSYGYSLYNLLINTEKNGQGFMLDIVRSWAENDYLYEREDGTEARRENNDSSTTSLLTKLLLDLGGWDTTLSGSLSEQLLGSPGSEGSIGMLTPTDKVDTHQYLFALSTARSFGPDEAIEIKASRLHNRVHSLTFFSGDIWSRLTSDYADVTYTKKMGILDVRPGIALRRERIASDDYGIHSRSTASAILGSSLDLDPVLLSLTVRRDRSSAFDGRWTYHGGARWKVMPHFNLQANAGTGYHEPTMGHLYTPSSWYLFISNPDLKPEKSFSFDIGPVLDFTTFGMGASYFVTRYEDLIKMAFPAPNTFTYENVDKARAAGIEAFAWIKPVEPVRLSANYAFNQFRYASGAFESKTIRLKPSQVFTFRGDYLPVVLGKQTDIFMAYQFREGVYKDDANTEKTGNRNIFDTGVSLEIARHAAVAFKVSNLFNDTSVEFEDKSEWGTFWYPVPGRTYRGSIQLSF